MHFAQASDTSLATNKVIDELLFSGSIKIAQKILKESETIEELLNDYTSQELLKLFKCTLPPIDFEFTANDMINLYNK